MSVPGSRQPEPQLNFRGAVDLSALKARATATPPASTAPHPAAASPGPGSTDGGAAPETGRIDLDEATFGAVVQRSATVPVVVLLWASYSPESQRLRDELGAVVGSYGGRLLYAAADVDAFPQLAEAFGVQAVPTAVAILKGQPIPLFQGAAAEQQSRQLFDELLRVAEANGVTGTVGGEPAPAQEPELPPLHQEAFDAIDRGDFAAAEEAYRRALADHPADREAKAGLAQVQLMARVAGIDQPAAEQARSAAAAAPDDLAAQLAVADLDVVGGHVEDGFSRLVAFISRSSGEEREAARVRLLELFEVIGAADPRVSAARAQLARALF
ncbi:co-chaperone YbbN [Sinomonas cellulolyticus]|uniref:Tetratricopeptide repeat protein n=1 Tax=Sinomonas cellulolyticus TaxID=2801916 RepID=A0ABS1K4U8_9MICC|nr:MULTISPECIES: tetratricopeptide repeat protein [Sinomonas]MBL0706498.1 tetratricopeptide repeat protein [Sinomonas cellulolyticus]GHG44952.1 co-chaperone YbbN [Sinomonas sp. KCTC 49339]